MKRTRRSERFADADALWHWLANNLNLRLPRQSVCPTHQAPFDYLRHAYFEPASDVVVWAPRGGGKTRLGAVATLLDLMHKPPCAIRILGGSLQQSLRMWEHLLPDAEQHLQGALTGKPTAMRLRCKSGATAAVLTQSERAVRGLRVQKLRCDEVENFTENVWTAAQLVTRTLRPENAHGAAIAGVVEAFSTLHEAHGLMSRVIEQAQTRGTRIIRWCLLDVLERCPPERACAACPLWEDCRGVAKLRCQGHIAIDDAIAAKRRVSRETWEAEMLCRRPSRRHSVFGSFDHDTHVRETSALMAAPANARHLALAIDFGYAAPFVCLWVLFDDASVHVIDEYLQPQRTVEEHLRHIAQRPWGAARCVTCDPAGSRRDEQTAESNLAILRRAGYAVRTRQSRIVDGIERIRADLRPGAGPPRLFIHPRCRQLIAALREYHYAPDGSELPVKDGTHDHPIDALRYFYVNRPAGSDRPGRRY